MKRMNYGLTLFVCVLWMFGIIVNVYAADWKYYANDAPAHQIVQQGSHLWLACYASLIDYFLETGAYVAYNSNNSPIPATGVNQMIISDNGVLYLATDEGLIVKNGNEWSVLTPNNSSLPSNIVHSVAMGPDQTLWIATQAGVVKMVGSTMTPINLEPSTSSSCIVSEIAVSQDNHVLVGYQFCAVENYYNARFWMYDGADWSSYPVDDSFQHIRAYQNSFYVSFVNGISLWDGNHFQSITNDGNPNDFVVENDSTIWYSSYSGLNHFVSGQITVYNTTNSALDQNETHAVYLDHDHNLWVNTDRLLYRLHNHTFEGHEYYDRTLAFQGSSSIAVDSLNNKWVASQNGLLKFDNHAWTLYNTENSAIPFNDIQLVTADASNHVWILGGSNQLAKFDGINWTVWPLNVDSTSSFYGKKMKADPQGRIWIVGYNGIMYFDGTNFIFPTHDFEVSIKDFDIDSMGSVWFASDLDVDHIELFRFNGTGVDVWTPPLTDITSVDNILIDREDHLWLTTSAVVVNGSTNCILWEMAGDSWIQHEAYNSNSMMSNLTVDAANNVWFFSSYWGWEIWDTGYTGLVQYTNQGNYIPMTGYREDRLHLGQSICVDQFDNIWIGGAQSVAVYNENTVVGTNDPASMPAPVTLVSVYPNPFRDVATIHYDVKTAGETKLCIYNIKGQLVKTLLQETKNPASYKVQWNGLDNQNRPVASGIYFLRYQNQHEQSTKKMVLLK